jgi:asparagine synthase (glutamine-hydrolysing)
MLRFSTTVVKEACSMSISEFFPRTAHPTSYIERVVNLLDPQGNVLLDTTLEDAESAVRSGVAARVRAIRGQFAILQQEGKTIRMARSIGRPMRYFLAKQAAGPCLIVAERIDEIYRQLRSEGLENQFHPSYTRMVPAHHLIELQLVGCPDPNPQQNRFFSPQRNQLPADVTAIGTAYVSALATELSAWLDRIPSQEPIGVMFSGGIDSGALLMLLNYLLLQRGEAPQRLKAFTLAVDRDAPDVRQAVEFARQTNLSMLLEVLDVDSQQVDWRAAIRVVEDYKPLDVQAAAVALAAVKEIRQRYPEWRYLVDGDGGDENLKDYPIEDNPELTIRSVLNNRMLYQEGWGVDCIKHSLVYSGGQSRGHVRSFAPAKLYGFEGFSPYALPNVIEVAEGIPFIELTQWDHDKLYALKGQILAAGMKQVTGLNLPVYEKRRFQEGAVAEGHFNSLFPASPSEYRNAFAEIFANGQLLEAAATSYTAS